MGGGGDKPSARQFRYRFRWHVLDKHGADMFMDSANTEDNGDETLGRFSTSRTQIAVMDEF